MQVKQSIYSLQAYRAIAASLVVVFHAADIIRIKLDSHVFGDLLLFGFSGVPMFFVLSGFIIFYIHAQDIDRPSRLGRYLYKRFVRIYPLYWFILLLLLPRYLGRISNSNYLLENITLLRLTKFDKIIDVSWTLSYEIFFYIIFLSLILHRGLGILGIFICACLSSYSLITGYFLEIPYIISTITTINYGTLNNLIHIASDPINFLFLMGVISSAIYFRIAHHYSTKDSLGVIALVVGISIFISVAIVYNIYGYTIMSSRHYYLLWGLASMFLMIAPASVHVESFFKDSRTLMFLGNASYSLYLVHLIIQKLMMDSLVIRSMNPYLIFFLLISISVILGVGVYLLIERPLLERFNHLNKNNRTRNK